MSSKEEQLKQIREEALGFIDKYQTMILSTIGQDNNPNASYAPYLFINGSFYIFISELSQHTKNLLNNDKCSILFIEPEEKAKHIFARKRLTIQGNANEVMRNDTNYWLIIDALADKFGDIVKELVEMSDFHLFEIKPNSAGYVCGFARAYTLTGQGLREIKHLNEEGHRRRVKETG